MDYVEYIITNLENGNRYIGSSIDLYERLKRHFYELNNNCHSNPHLQNAWNKYHEDNFDYGIGVKILFLMRAVQKRNLLNY